MPTDKPFALVENGVHGLTISAVNAIAAREGVAVGTALADARAALPALLSRPAERDNDRRALLKLARWAGRYGPSRHVDGEDGLWVDITGVAHLFGGEQALLDDLTRRLASFGVPAVAGLADTFGAAHAMARFACPQGAAWALALAGETRTAIAGLPVEALRIDTASILLLKRLGLRRIGQLFDIPRDSLMRRFRSKDAAAAVVLRLDQALGLRKEPLRALRAAPVLSVMRAFAEPLISSEAIEAVAAALADELAAALSEKDLGARALCLSLYRADGTSAEVRAALSVPSRDGSHIMMLLKEKLSHVDAGFGIDGMRLDAARADRQGALQGAFADTGARPEAGALIDRLSNRFGADAVLRLETRASHIPERAEARVSALKPLQYDFNYEPPWPCSGGHMRRPTFLLPRPERIEVLAEVPDGPPVRFTWRRVARRIARAEGPERIAPEWWRHIGAGEGAPTARLRDYYRIEDQEGASYWVFRHGLFNGAQEDPESDPPRWYLHGFF